jgi:hypothetical protein
MTELTPEEYARAMMEAQIQILVNEAIATSAIEGIKLDPKEVRKAVLRHLAMDYKLPLLPGVDSPPVGREYGSDDALRLLLHDVPDEDLQAACRKLGEIWSVDPAALIGDPPERLRALALLEIWESVGDLHQAEEDARAWPRRALTAPGFDGRTPLEVMQTGLKGLELVRDFLRDVLQR